MFWRQWLKQKYRVNAVFYTCDHPIKPGSVRPRLSAKDVTAIYLSDGIRTTPPAEYVPADPTRLAGQ